MLGILYVVATPIGNLEDITARAVRVLGEVSLIAAEDTRHSGILLAFLKIKTPMFSCHKFNEGKRGDFFVSALQEGRDVALISDAGTPCISDPGYRLVGAAAEAGIKVVPVCGASAAVAALSVSGFDLKRFGFIGFLPRIKSAAKKILSESISANDTVVFYESPKRISATLALINEEFPTAQICLCNDISKKFERIYRGTAEQIISEILQNPAAEKGEYTCVINSVTENVMADEAFSLEARLVDIMIKSGGTLKDASIKLHETLKSEGQKLPKKEIYAAMLRLRELSIR
ncbi:MAG: 16S rRNA (cytidine(1402)-2'-O)-methyltransferase [Defluviitaleaceae bacterium]|nr:16S rRNA (cytidine(1402)-2'-O)-methyltransferase [Defluviitaleaceae bacterium]